MPFVLKTPEEVTALINGQDFAALPLLWKQQIAGQMAGAADTLTLVVPVLLSKTASALEASFIKALVLTAAPPSPGAADPAATLPWMPSVTSVGDGASASLERVATVGRDVPDLRIVYVPAANQVQNWLLQALTATTDLSAIPPRLRPSDFDAATNAKVWVLQGTAATIGTTSGTVAAGDDARLVSLPTTYLSLGRVGVNGGVCELNSSGMVPLQRCATSLSGGTFDVPPTADSPDLISGGTFV